MYHSMYVSSFSCTPVASISVISVVLSGFLAFRKKLKTLYFGQAFPSLIVCVPACWIYELDRQTDNDNEPDSDLQRL